MRWLILMIAVSLTAMAPASAREKPILRAGSETRSPGETRPSKELTRTVIATLDENDISLLDGCIADKGLKHGDYAALLRVVKIPAGHGRNLWFVRAADKPYCVALYGAHLFRYFLIEEQHANGASSYRVVFQRGGDEIAVYAKQSHGLNDIQTTGCIAIGCRTARWSYDGRQYQPIQCTAGVFDDNGRAVTRPRRCGSDDGPDDQASGFWPDK